MPLAKSSVCNMSTRLSARSTSAHGVEPPFRKIWGIGGMPIQHFCAQKPNAINESAICNPTVFKRPYTEPVSCREAEVDNSVQFKRCDLSVMRKKLVRADAAVSRRENETRKVQADGLWFACTSIGNED